MLPKKNRADTKAVEKIFKEGKFLNSPNLTFKFLLQPTSYPPRISFLAPKTIAKQAVKRNLLRRCGYAAIEKNNISFTSLPRGLIGVFIFKKYQDDVSILANEIKIFFDTVH